MIDRTKFASKKELIKYLIKNKADLIHMKKSATKFTDPFFIELLEGKATSAVAKIINSYSQDDEENGMIKRTVIGNTYGWMDSHNDVHIPGIFTKTIQENKNIAHLHDHVFQLDYKVGEPQKIYEQSMPWRQLGVDKKGNTTCLLMDTEILKVYNPYIFEQYLKKKIKQHSVGMQYVKLFLCVDDEDYKEEFANWNTYIDYVANEDTAIENGYFWAVTEAKLREISCVIAGSNSLTGTIEPSNKGTHSPIEPQKSTQKKKAINYKFISENL